jgi:membrane protein YqaA with SNARE-associated domain
MSLLSLAAVGFIGTVFWLVSPEAAIAVAGAQRRWSPLDIGLVAAAGQSLALVGLFFFGEQLRRRWRWFDQKCEQARARSRLGRPGYAGSIVAGAAVLGFPPISVTAALLPGVAPRPLRLLPLMLLLRFARFTALAWGARATGWHLPW